MSVSQYEADALAQGDALSCRSDSISSTESADPSLSYQRSLFKHTNIQYLRAKDRLAKQSLRKSRNTAQKTTDISTTPLPQGPEIGAAKALAQLSL